LAVISNGLCSLVQGTVESAEIAYMFSNSELKPGFLKTEPKQNWSREICGNSRCLV